MEISLNKFSHLPISHIHSDTVYGPSKNNPPGYEEFLLMSTAIKKKRIHIICPVRLVTSEQQIEIDAYCKQLEDEGYEVHNPIYAVDQDDPTGGVNICLAHFNSMNDPYTIRVDVFWNDNSKGSHFDLGMAFALAKPLKLVKTYIGNDDEKSYYKVLQTLSKEYS